MLSVVSSWPTSDQQSLEQEVRWAPGAGSATLQTSDDEPCGTRRHPSNRFGWIENGGFVCCKEEKSPFTCMCKKLRGRCRNKNRQKHSGKNTNSCMTLTVPSSTSTLPLFLHYPPPIPVLRPCHPVRIHVWVNTVSVSFYQEIFGGGTSFCVKGRLVSTFSSEAMKIRFPETARASVVCLSVCLLAWVCEWVWKLCQWSKQEWRK